jgi:hypothetical protein
VIKIQLIFLNYAKERKIRNTIWEMPNTDRSKATKFNERAGMGVNYFSYLFTAPNR